MGDGKVKRSENRSWLAGFERTWALSNEPLNELSDRIALGMMLGAI